MKSKKTTNNLLGKLRRVFKKKLLLSEAIPFVVENLEQHRQRSRSTGGRYKYFGNKLIEMFGDLPVRAYTPEMIQTWYDHECARISRSGEPLSPKTVKSNYFAIRGLFASLEKYRHIDKNPCQIEIEPEPITHDEPQPFVTKAEAMQMIDGTQPIRDRAIMQIALESGARLSEINLMKISTTHIGRWYRSNSGKSIVLQRNQLAPTGCTERLAGVSVITIPKRNAGYVKFGHEASHLYLKWLKFRPTVTVRGHEDYVWLSRLNRLISVSAFYDIFVNAGQRVGLEHTSPKAFRQGFGRRTRLSGAPTQWVSGAMNHSSTDTTERMYQRLGAEDQLTEYLRLSDWLSENEPD